LGGWHLAIVCELSSNNEKFAKVNFVEYPNGKRDEWLAKLDVERIAGPFVNTEGLFQHTKEGV
jgi:hypothetical protein